MQQSAVMFQANIGGSLSRITQIAFVDFARTTELTQASALCTLHTGATDADRRGFDRDTGIVLGIGFLWAFALLPGPVQVYGTIWALLLAYVALGTPVAVRVMSAASTRVQAEGPPEPMMMPVRSLEMSDSSRPESAMA